MSIIIILSLLLVQVRGGKQAKKKRAREVRYGAPGVLSLPPPLLSPPRASVIGHRAFIIITIFFSFHVDSD